MDRVAELARSSRNEAERQHFREVRAGSSRITLGERIGRIACMKAIRDVTDPRLIMRAMSDLPGKAHEEEAKRISESLRRRYGIDP